MPTLLGEKREGGVTYRKNGRTLTIETTWNWRVKADTIDQNRFEIQATPGLPVVGWTLYGPSVCVGKDANRDPINPLYWDVETTFSTEDESEGQGNEEGDQGDPTLWVPIAEIAFETYTEVGLVDADGDPVTNSAGQPFETGFTRTRTLARMDFFQFEPATGADEINEETLMDRNESVNLTEYKGKAAKTLKLSIKSAVLGYYYGYSCWKVGYSVTYKRDTWRQTRLDIGNCYLSGSNLLPYTDNATPPNRIVGNLDGSGAKAATPSVLYFDEFPAIEFADFLRV